MVAVNGFIQYHPKPLKAMSSHQYAELVNASWRQWGVQLHYEVSYSLIGSLEKLEPKKMAKQKELQMRFRQTVYNGGPKQGFCLIFIPGSPFHKICSQTPIVEELLISIEVWNFL